MEYNFLLEQIDQTPVTVVIANHARRSETLLNLLTKRPLPLFYYALRLEYSTLGALLASLLDSLKQQVPHFQNAWVDYLLPSHALPFKEWVGRWHHILGQLSDELFLFILDDYELLGNHEDIHNFLDALLASPPAHCRFLISSRSLPPFPWSLWLAKRHVILVQGWPFGGHLQEKRAESWRVQALGSDAVFKPDGSLVTRWEGHLPRLLLIFVLENPSVPRQKLWHALWPDLEERNAMNVFHVTKRRLHKALGSNILVHHEGCYQVDPSYALIYDVFEFVEALVRGRTSRGSEAETAWQAALEAYRGPYLQGYNLPWLLPYRQAYQNAYREALLNLQAVQTARQEWDIALKNLTTGLQYLDEVDDIHARIMEIYRQSGRRSEAIAHYQNLTRTLATPPAQAYPRSYQIYLHLQA
jgi:DNA-binding SARP family transcriptional activator